MVTKTLRDLLIHEMQDLYDAEHQLVIALDEMAKASLSSDLKAALENHLDETRIHITRLERVFRMLGEQSAGETSLGMKGLIEEGKKILNDEMEAPARDAALIGAARRIEHYEIAGYGTARTFAHILGHQDAAHMLQQTLDEEEQADKKLTQVAIKINVKAIGEIV